MRIAVFTAGALLIASGEAAAGPPYVTDDPEPTDPGGWEIYAFTTGATTPGGFDGATGLDLNYGAAPGVQLTATLPLDYTHRRGTQVGIGDAEIGVKYRFLHRESAGLAIAVFPRIILPTAGKRFGSGRVALLLPLWGQQDFGPWSLFGGGGYAINPGSGNRNFWQGGVALSREMSSRLSLGGEITRQGADAAGARSYTAANIGGTYRLSGPFAILASAGPGLSHRRDGGRFNAYLALAMLF